MLTTQEKIDNIGKINKRQYEQARDILQNALSDSNIDTDYYGEVRGIAMQMATLAIQQKEERDALFAVMNNEPIPLFSSYVTPQ
jgi:hypothetical protein